MQVSKAVTQQFFRGANIMNTACEVRHSLILLPSSQPLLPALASSSSALLISEAAADQAQCSDPLACLGSRS